MKDTGYIGVDPGAKGQVCLLVPNQGAIAWVANELSPSIIAGTLTAWSTNFHIPIIMIEDVHSLHKMSAKSNFGMGYNLGEITTICKMSGIGLDKVSPKVWKGFIGVKPKSPSPKKDVEKIIKTIYPTAAIYGSRGGLDDGKADSLMIAHYCFKQMTK